MRALVLSCILLALFALTGRCARADAAWHRVAKVEEVAITVTAASSEELAALRRTFGSVDRRDLRGASIERGFAVLRVRGGVYSCKVYLLELEDAATLEHETKHCHGWSHQ